jgi:excisionase family DNA binding protein
MHDNRTTVGSEYLTKAEAAEYAKCSLRTIDRAIEDRRLRAVGGRGRRRIRPEWSTTGSSGNGRDHG